MIASAQYRNAAGRQAQVVIFPSAGGHVVCAYVENDTNQSPLWMERDLKVDDAKIWGNLFHKRLVRDYNMQRVEAAA